VGEDAPPFDLRALDADPARAAQRYREIRRDLVRFAEWQGCHDPEDAADDALFRGLKRLAEGIDVTTSGARGFLFGVVKNVVRERARAVQREQPLEASPVQHRAAPARDHARVEARLALAQALRALEPRDRMIVVRYCLEDDRAALSRHLGVSPGHLRLMVHRIRSRIRAQARGEATEP
jgi:RNA polymerase sigma factor (sigma-70 family)